VKTLAKLMVRDMIKMPDTDYSDNEVLTKTLVRLHRKYREINSKEVVSKRWLSWAYKELNRENPKKYPLLDNLYRILIKKSIRSDSGIINVSVVMPGENFSCKYNCRFCPNEPGMPRSYLSNEDAVQRGTREDFDAAKQAWVRFTALENIGHPLDKIEYRILGGTFSCYPHNVAHDFIRDLYYAANTYYSREDGNERPRLSMREEQDINTSATIHVVGVGVETRPDEITESEIIRFREYGVTRVELGVQHTDDLLLRKMNRGHGIKHSKAAIKLLKDYGFKVEIHIMTDLPGATPDGDKECYNKVLVTDPDLIPDYLKDYPCLDVSFTEIKKWKQDGRWTPYSEFTNDASILKDVLIYRQKITPKWVRVNRIQRDFRPEDLASGIIGYDSPTIKSNLADIVKKEAESQGIYCQCIRCREIRDEKFNPKDIKYMEYSFLASGGIEYYISAEIPRPNRDLLLGFIRLRLSNGLAKSIVPELDKNTAMIRELHVYGKVSPVGKSNRNGAQHLGIGKNLLKRAEQIAYESGYDKMAIISGIGVRDYYRKNGYSLNGTYMTKKLEGYINIFYWSIVVFIAVIIFIISITMSLM
jgi:ELP3 family radical SAM enzyme/protein acetyltransferase